MPSIPDESLQPPTVSSSPFATIGEILPSVGISKRRFRQVESICLIREQRASGRQELAFNARPFVLCGLPLRRPPSSQVIHRRRNGNFFLHIVAHPDYGLPFGQDRLIPIWVSNTCSPAEIPRDSFRYCRPNARLLPSSQRRPALPPPC
jgi:hypothetical protein